MTIDRMRASDFGQIELLLIDSNVAAIQGDCRCESNEEKGYREEACVGSHDGRDIDQHRLW